MTEQLVGKDAEKPTEIPPASSWRRSFTRGSEATSIRSMSITRSSLHPSSTRQSS